ERAQRILGARIDGQELFQALFGARRAARMLLPQRGHAAVERGALALALDGLGLPPERLDVFLVLALGLIEPLERAQRGKVARIVGRQRFVAGDRLLLVVEALGEQRGRFGLERARLLARRVAGALVENGGQLAPLAVAAMELAERRARVVLRRILRQR